MLCQNENCKIMLIKNQNKKERYMSQMEDVLQDIQDRLINDYVSVAFLVHSEHRALERSFSKSVILEALVEGYLIDFVKINNKQRFLLMYSYKIAPRTFRPMHLVFQLESHNSITIITQYDPRTEDVWQDNYSTRVCFCKRVKNHLE